LAAARLYLICGARSVEFVEAALRGRVDIVQLRVKDAPDEDVADVAAEFARACADNGALFIVNDRPQVAASVGADGVHVGQDDMAVADARAVVGEDALVGLSTHTPAQVDAAIGVDYIGVGPVHATPTKPGRPAVGLDLVRYAAQHAAVPFFAIGGIDLGNVAAVHAAGASRIAVVRALGDAADVTGAARALRSAVDREVGVGWA
jgi:thiamine-phosphate pyrophosphorylase